MSNKENLIQLIDFMPPHEGKTFEEALADHILAAGWIKPICQPGDKVYCIFRNRETLEYYIAEKKVYEVRLSEAGITIFVSPLIGYSEPEIGVRLFFNKEDGERKLKLLQEGNTK